MKIRLSLLAKSDEKSSESNVWYLDNGASNHMTGYKEKFVELDKHVTGQVRIGDGSTVEIKGKRTVMLMCKNGELKAMHDVYYIPHLRNKFESDVRKSQQASNDGRVYVDLRKMEEITDEG